MGVGASVEKTCERKPRGREGQTEPADRRAASQGCRGRFQLRGAKCRQGCAWHTVMRL